MDPQWEADVANVQQFPKHNGSAKYNLKVIIMLVKYSWTERENKF